MIAVKQILTEEQMLKEKALKNAESLTEDEEKNGILSVEEVRESVLSEFNRLADEIEREDGSA